MLKKTNKMILRLTSAALAAILGLSGMPYLLSGRTVFAGAAWEKTLDNTKLGVDQISYPKPPYSATSSWIGSYVYFGKYEGEPIKFRVLDPNTTRYGGRTMLLDSDKILFKQKFSTLQQNCNEWETSDVRASLNGSDFLQNSRCFTPGERSAVAKSSINGDVQYDSSSYIYAAYKKSVGLSKDKVFLLDAGDVVNPDYGYSSDPGFTKNGSEWSVDSNNTHEVTSRLKKFEGENDYWMLRTKCGGSSYHIGLIRTTGPFGSTMGNGNIKYAGVAPALNIDRSKILFSSVVSGKSEEYGAEYKLTIIDDNLNKITNPAANWSMSGSKLCIPVDYNTAVPGYAFEELQFRLLITDLEYADTDAEILYYLAVSDIEYENGLAIEKFTIPNSLQLRTWGDEYHVYLVAEQTNGKYECDFASRPYELRASNGTVQIDLTYGETELLMSQTRALYDMVEDGFPNYDYEDDVYSIDIDFDGSYDMYFDTYGSPTAGILDSCSVFGTDIWVNDDVTRVGYYSYSFVFPVCMPEITKAEPTDTGVQIKWDAVSRYKNYNVYRSTSLNGTYSYVASVTGGTTKYVDKTATGGKTYYYKVRPYKKYEGKTYYATFSLAKKVTVLSDTKLTAEPKSGVTMKLSWTAVSGAQSYEIYRSTSASGPYTYVKATTGTSTSDTGLTAGTRYYYMVRAKKTVNGENQYSKYASAVAVALATPTLESATFKSGKGVTLNWTKASGADRYNVYKYNTSTGKYDYVASVLGGTLTYTDATGKKGDYYKVRAYKRVDGVVYYGGWSNAKAGK
ncbi:MAG: hypothetical protein J5379_02085 [Clostridiales bacterium]|nr:hypothetical protein [Clostridiales bacterium]